MGLRVLHTDGMHTGGTTTCIVLGDKGAEAHIRFVSPSLDAQVSCPNRSIKRNGARGIEWT